MLFALASCAQLLQEPLNLELAEDNLGMPLTKTVTDKESKDYGLIDHFFQTNHRMMLVRHMVFRDTVFVQTLTNEDMITLKMSDQDQAAGLQYLSSLNAAVKNKVN